MRLTRLILICITVCTLSGCAGRYKIIDPENISYVSTSSTSNVKLEYKYELLHRKYAKKEIKNGIRLVALKITNHSDKDLIFGRDAVLVYGNGSEVTVLEHENTFHVLKQIPPTYLLYLLLTPSNLYIEKPEEEKKKVFPVGLILGPALAGGNMIAAGSANKKFETEMRAYNILGAVIKSGETKYGLVGIRSHSFESLKLRID